MPQEGHDKQEGAQRAGTRWRRHHAHALAPHHVTVLGDALDSPPPLCAFALAKGFTCILVCKPDSPPTLYERLALWHANDGIATGERRPWPGRFPAMSLDRLLHDVSLLDGPEALSVTWCASTVVNAKTGEPLSHTRFMTHHRVTVATVAAVAQAGRGRWQIAHENPHVLTTKGSHVAHNCGHGKQDRAAVLLSLHLIALLFHTVLEWSDTK
jgi:hypothetical protein